METGLATQIGFAEEAAYGTRTAPSRFLDLISESLVFDPGRRESKSIRPNKRVLGSQRWQPSKKTVSGSVELPFLDAGMGMLLKHALGSISSAQPDAAGNPTVYEHTGALGNPKGLSLTTQVGRATTDGTTNPFDYLGCKVTKWALTQAVDDDLTLALDLDGQDEDTSQTLAVATYPADTEVLGWDELAVTIDGNPFNTASLSLQGENAMKTDRYFAGSRAKKEPLLNDMTGITGSLEGEWQDTVVYELVRAGTIVAVTMNWTGRLISGAFNRALEITLPACRLDGETPTAGGPDEIPQKVSFKALDNYTDEPITVVYRTTDTTP